MVGCDGSGKSTLARFVVEELRRRGHRPVLLWSRFNNIVSKPLLALARVFGHSTRDVHDGITFGYHDFDNVFWLRWPFALLQALDVNLAVRLKLRNARKHGDVIVFERSPWDTVADVILDTGCMSLVTNRLGKWMVSSVSSPDYCVLWIDRPITKILETRMELKHDRKLVAKRAIYSKLAGEYDWLSVDNSPPLATVCQGLTTWLDNKGF